MRDSFVGLIYVDKKHLEFYIWGVAGSAPTRRCEEEAEPEGEAIDLPVNLRSYPHLWSRVVGSDRKNEIANTSSRNGLPPQGVWALP